MKRQFAFVLLGIVASSSAFAASSKICFGMGSDKGARFQLDFTKKTAKISNAVGDQAIGFEGKWPAEESVSGRDGKIDLAYRLPYSDGSNTLLVDEALLAADGVGQAKLRWQGESFGETKFFCRNSSN